MDKRNGRVQSAPPAPSDAPQPRHHAYRLTVVAVVFVFVCMLYMISIIRIQLNAAVTVSAPEDNYTTRTVLVQAVRGQIYDRNGKPLVTNEYDYSVIFDYAGMSAGTAQQNGDILSVIDMIEKLGDNDLRPESFCPLTGLYPYMGYDTEMLEGSLASARLSRILKTLDLEPDAGANELAAALAARYRMLDKEGNPLFSDREMTELLRVRYEMEAIQFSPSQPYTLLTGIGIREITRVKELGIRGTDIRVSYSRVYHYPGYASHILGRISKIYAEDADYYTSQGYPITAVVGVSGCEMAFEPYLRGMDGEMTLTEDADGNVVSAVMTKEPEPGQDVWLTIDIDLQITAEEALAENILYINAMAETTPAALDGEDADCGAIVAQAANTGDVLAIASYPTFDIVTFNRDYAELSADERHPMFNRALEGTYAPGSTFKVGMAVAAISESVRMDSGEYFTPTTKINTTGIYTYYPDYQPKCWIYDYGHQSHGSIDVSYAIQVSCNCFFYELGRLLGIDTINKYCRIYGLGQSTGIELYEDTGILADNVYSTTHGLGPWTGGTTIQTAIGQGYNQFTPLQIAGYISTIVNGGTRYSAHLLREVRDFGGGTVYTSEPSVIDRLNMPQNTLNVIRNAMSKVIEGSSTVTTFADFPLKVGGKTGTAQVSEKHSNNAVFVAFAPLDTPELVVSCVIERGAKGANASRAVRKVMDKYFGYAN